MSTSGLYMQAHIWAHMPPYVHIQAYKNKITHLSTHTHIHTLEHTHVTDQGLLSVFLNQASKVKPENLVVFLPRAYVTSLGSSKPSPKSHCTLESTEMKNREAKELVQGLTALVLQPGENSVSAPSTVLTWDNYPLTPCVPPPSLHQLSRGQSRSEASLEIQAQPPPPPCSRFSRWQAGGWMKVEAK